MIAGRTSTAITSLALTRTVPAIASRSAEAARSRDAEVAASDDA